MKCRACGKETQFIKSAKGKPIPCEVEKTKVVTAAGNVMIGFEPHWGNCTDPDKFREDKK